MSSRGRNTAGVRRSNAAAIGGRDDHSDPARAQYGYGHGIGAMRPAVLGLAKLLVLPAVSAAPLGLFRRGVNILEEESKPTGDPQLWLYLGVALALVLGGGIFAGLTIALMGQDETYLQVLATSGEGSERKHAATVLRLLKRGKHWVLVTLLLSNVITNETLPIVLDRSLGGGWPAVLGSTVLIVIFGEVAPQSICVRYGLSIGAYMAPVVLVFMYLLSPVAWPTAKLLDYLLGDEHGTTYKKAGLKTLVQLHKTLGTVPGERLMEDEVHIISSVLDLKDKRIDSVMTPMQDVFTMSVDTVLDERMMETILSQGYSRIPIYAPDNHRNFIGMLLVKILITYDPEDALRVRDFALATLPETHPYTSCLDIINFFQEGKSHMVLVSDEPGTDHGALGVVTLEDVIEELIGEEIVDESDVFIDVHKAIRRLTPAESKRYRMSKANKLVEVEDGGMISESEYDKADGEHAPLLKVNSRQNSQANGQMQQVPAATSFMVRKNSNASDLSHDIPRPAPMRSNTTDLRQHLKHLGPSNLATRPRATKYQSVKIKPGVGTIPEGQATTTGTDAARSRSLSVDRTNGETLPLLEAGRNASDGVAALQSGYGTNSGSITGRLRGMSESDKMPPQEATKVAEENTTSPPAAEPSKEREEKRSDTLQIPPKLIVPSDGYDGDAVGEMEGPSRDRSKSRRAARSGSITETTVDVNGLKKVILDPHSSSNSDVEDSPATSASGRQSKEGGLDGGADADNEDGGSGSRGADGKKKKNKKKKKKGGVGW
ncbi:cell agglutination protein Mam3 [Recurvomyces mirabilis]|nr:cell agglutination protein Mam3 [Recurvomyces mirabilis]